MNDDAFDRLRAADPAHHAPEPAAGVLRAKIDALIGTDAPGATGAQGETAASASAPGGRPSPDTTGTGGTGTTGADELARRRSRRRGPLLVAAAVAGFIAVGGGGYAAGSNGLELTLGAGGSEADSAAAPIELGTPGAGTGGTTMDDSAGEPERAPGVAPETQQEVGPDTAVGTFMYPPVPSRTVFHPGAGLSDAETEHEAYALDAGSAYTRDMAERTARALGVRGDARQEGGAWVVGPQDGTGAGVRLAADGRTSVMFTDPGSDSWRCGIVEPALPQELPVPREDGAAGSGSSGSTSGSDPAVAPDSQGGEAPDCPEGDAGAPSAAEATDELRRLMEALDVDVDAYDLEADPSSHGTSVTALHRLDGRRTGLQWSATVSGTGSDAGFAALNGFLAPVTELGTYPVVSEREAVDRLGDARFGAAQGDVRTMRDLSSSSSDGTTAGGPPATLDPGAAIAWPVRDVTITGARLGLAQHALTDGAIVLLPAYEMVGDGGTWSVVAVGDDLLDFAGR
ncbi:hypothetical protein [Myceligenerans cantabricum]